MKKADDLAAELLANAAELRRLHARVHETFARRDESQQCRHIWETACKEFNNRYDMLAFPGGYWLDGSDSALARIAGGDPQTIEAALCFVEVRPYFFRSGYMFTALLRKLKRAALSPRQTERLQHVLHRQALWRSRRTRAR